MIQASCSAAMTSNVRLPFAGQPDEEGAPVGGNGRALDQPFGGQLVGQSGDVPLVTINRRDSSPILSPAGLRSSCAIRSKRGSVIAKRSRSCARTRRSIVSVQVSSRNHRRRDSWCASWSRDSGSGAATFFRAFSRSSWFTRSLRERRAPFAPRGPGCVRVARGRVRIAPATRCRGIRAGPRRAASSTGSARCGRPSAHRSARPAIRMLLTWSGSKIAPTAIVAMPVSLRTRSANGVWYMRP